ncbi:MAG: Holliday junction branch migration protein RuvA [Rhodobacteraceae bacterium]|nr:MAG: Holliday junction branch migration protein RuvA [Paracoccaceae bacterium]
MIGKVTGRMDYRNADHVLIDTGGVGYIVYCSERTLAAMPAAGGMVSLYTEMVVRQDFMQLYGFPTIAEREWHRLLTSVQGVGAKAALAILGTLGTEGTGRAITLGDMGAIKAAPGIGPKIAQRVVNELKGKAPAIMALGASGTQAAEPDDDLVIEPLKAKTVTPAPQNGSAAAQADALSALVNLGYGTGDAASAVAEASGADPEAESSALIRAALRLLAPKG